MPIHPLKTLDRVLSKAGLGSRTEARTWIGAGRVQVNGTVIQSPDHWVDLARDEVSLDGKPVEHGERIYLLLYKPKGYLTTYKDPEGRPTVYNLLEGVPEYVVPVGRLDLDSSGLLILTNDTQFAERIMNPEYKVPKTYLVKAAGPLSEQQLQQLRDGVELSDGPSKRAAVTRVRDRDKSTFLEITITEGRNRQVRRMLEAVNSRVRKLVRTAIGSVRIDGLEIGKHRILAPEEVNALAGTKWIKLAGVDGRSAARNAAGRDAAKTSGGPKLQKQRSGGGKEPLGAPEGRTQAAAPFWERRMPKKGSAGSTRRSGASSPRSTPGGRGTVRPGPKK